MTRQRKTDRISSELDKRNESNLQSCLPKSLKTHADQKWLLGFNIYTPAMNAVLNGKYKRTHLELSFLPSNFKRAETGRRRFCTTEQSTRDFRGVKYIHLH